MKIIIVSLLGLMLAAGIYLLISGQTALAPEAEPDAAATSTNGKIRADMFTGTLEEVNTGCFADGECYVVVDGKHVTVLMGWSQETVGNIIGAPSIGDLENFIGEEIEVYAQDHADGTYTLYGSEGFYIKVGADRSEETLPAPVPAANAGGCIVGGCSSQLCVDEAEGEVVSTCEYREVYACYQTATCERQASGQCGWTPTAELNACIANAQ